MNRRPLILFSAIVVMAMLAVSAWALVQLPADAEIPIHWSVEGEPDGFAPAPVGLLLMPGVVALIAGLFAIIPSIEPRRENFQQSRQPYLVLWVGIVSLLGALHVLVTAVALGSELEVGRIVSTGAGALFVLIGALLPRIRSNFLMGIRTPWTLTSDRSWARTHRLGGWLFVAVGLMLVVLGLVDVPGEVTFPVLIGGVTAIVVALVAYSYLVWRNDPDRAIG